MNKDHYSYSGSALTRYHFTSLGKQRVDKLVEFTPLAIKNIYNLGFGDLLSSGKVDDKVKTNNGDIVKVLATIVHIVKDFTKEKPEAKIVFKGSTKERTVLYQRILKTYLQIFSEEFVITALQGPAGKPVETAFDPHSKVPYLAFFVKRKM